MKRALVAMSLVAGLFLAGLFAASPLLTLMEILLHRPVVAVSPEEPLAFALSVAFLMAATVPTAIVLQCVYTRARRVKSSLPALTIALIISASSALAAIALRLIVLARLLDNSIDLPSQAAIRPQALGLLPWGLSGMLVVCGSIVAILLLTRPAKASAAP